METAVTETLLSLRHRSLSPFIQSPAKQSSQTRNRKSRHLKCLSRRCAVLLPPSPCLGGCARSRALWRFGSRVRRCVSQHLPPSSPRHSLALGERGGLGGAPARPSSANHGVLTASWKNSRHVCEWMSFR